MFFEDNFATISIDLDGVWTILQYHNLPYDISKDAVFEQSLPRFLDLLKELEVKATFFIVAKDLDDPDKVSSIKEILLQGHEVANHSWQHQPNFGDLPKKIKESEILKAQELISSVLQTEIFGFRTPGYALDKDLLEILEKNNYLYDSSLLPIYWSPLLRFFERLNRTSVSKYQFGSWRGGLAPLRPYHPNLRNIYQSGSANLWEIPLTVIPFLRLPYHSSFIMALGDWFFDQTWFIVKKSLNFVNFAFHGIDLIDTFSPSALPSYKKIKAPLEDRHNLFKKIITQLKDKYKLVTMSQLCKKLSERQLKPES